MNNNNANAIIFENSGENIKFIQSSAFSNCSNLIELDLLSSTIDIIDEYTFLSCQNLIAISFPSTLTALNENSFDGCIGINANGFDIPITVSSINGPIGITTFNSIPN